MPGSFFDTNVLLYLASNDSERVERTEVLLSSGGTISVQVLNEIANVCRRKMRLPWSETRSFLSTLRALLAVDSVTVETHKHALEVAERNRLSIYDALIVASALHSECDTLWSEDMQNGMRIEKRLRIVNPFIGNQNRKG
jgi:predicted nucleic acid-binding protein